MCVSACHLLMIDGHRSSLPALSRQTPGTSADCECHRRKAGPLLCGLPSAHLAHLDKLAGFGGVLGGQAGVDALDAQVNGAELVLVDSSNAQGALILRR